MLLLTVQVDPLRGGGVPGADGLPRGLLLHTRGEGRAANGIRQTHSCPEKLQYFKDT